MKAGTLDRRISILRATTAADAFNEPVETWATLATVWAQVTPLRDSERLAMRQTLAQATSRFTIRWSEAVSSVDPKHRISFDGKTWDIAGVKEIGRRDGLEITATARAEQT